MAAHNLSYTTVPKGKKNNLVSVVFCNSSLHSVECFCSISFSCTHLSMVPRFIHNSAVENPLEHREWLQKIPINPKLIYATRPWFASEIKKICNSFLEHFHVHVMYALLNRVLYRTCQLLTISLVQ